MSKLRATLVAVAALIALPAISAAQRPGLVEVDGARRGGFWINFGIGAGAERVNFANDALDYSDALWKPTVGLRLGGTVGSHLRLGGEVFAWLNEHGNALETISSFGLVAQYYPLARSGLFLKGSAGVARSGVSFSDTYTYYDTGDLGLSGALGAGWEVPLGKRFYLVPAVDLVQQHYGGGSAPSYREQVASFSVGITWQAGRR